MFRPLHLEPAGDLVEVDLRPVVARVAHGHHPVRTGDDVDLATLDAVAHAGAVVHRGMEVVALAHELRALARVQDGVDHGGAEPELRFQRVERLLVLR